MLETGDMVRAMRVRGVPFSEATLVSSRRTKVDPTFFTRKRSCRSSPSATVCSFSER